MEKSILLTLRVQVHIQISAITLKIFIAPKKISQKITMPNHLLERINQIIAPINLKAKYSIVYLLFNLISKVKS